MQYIFKCIPFLFLNQINSDLTFCCKILQSNRQNPKTIGFLSSVWARFCDFSKQQIVSYIKAKINFPTICAFIFLCRYQHPLHKGVVLTF